MRLCVLNVLFFLFAASAPLVSALAAEDRGSGFVQITGETDRARHGRVTLAKPPGVAASLPSIVTNSDKRDDMGLDACPSAHGGSCASHCLILQHLSATPQYMVRVDFLGQGTEKLKKTVLVEHLRPPISFS